MLANFSGVLYFLGMIYTFLSRSASFWIMQTTQKFTLQIPFSGLEHFNSDVANTCSPHVRESKTVLDSGFHVVDSRFQVLDSKSLSVGLGFWIPIVSGIPDSMSCIPDSKTRDCGFHKQNFSGSRVPLHGVNLFEQNGMKANPEKHQTLVRGNTNPHMNMRTETVSQS